MIIREKQTSFEVMERAIINWDSKIIRIFFTCTSDLLQCGRINNKMHPDLTADQPRAEYFLLWREYLLLGNSIRKFLAK